MKKQVILFFIVSLLTTPYHSASSDDYLTAIVLIKEAVLYDFDDQITPLITQYEKIKLEDSTDKIQHDLFKQLRIQSWGSQISEFSITMQLLFSYTPINHQQQYQIKFNQALQTIDDFRQQANLLTARYHPGYQLNASQLMARYQGDNIHIAVFDLFEPDLLTRQRLHYPHAKITAVNSFGSPVNLSHGNSVIDVILAIAPHATIIPVSSDSQHTIEAMQFMISLSQVNIINLSRAFLAREDKLDTQYSILLQDLLGDKLISKSLGNTGTDLDGNLTPLRQNKGLPPVGNLFSYDLELIKQFVQQSPNINHLFFGINGNLLNDNIALTATIPGNNPLVAQQSFIQLADGVASFSSDNYESGSSFSAPQISAIAALLWQALEQTRLEKHQIATIISHSLIVSATSLPSHPIGVIGNGNINGDNALALSTNFVDKLVDNRVN